MTRGRPRKPSTKIPAHIDQERIPRGLYFAPQGNGRWYLIEAGKKRYVASADAKLSELHALVEKAPAPASLDALCTAHQASRIFRARAPATRDDYARCAKIICGFVLKDGRKLGAIATKDLSRPVFQRLIDTLADQGTPSKAAHVGRYLGVLTRWGANQGMCAAGLAGKFNLPKERKDPRMPEREEMAALVAFARKQAGRGMKGNVAPYLWAVGELAYRLRLRGVEVLDLTDASLTAEGVYCGRRKGSESNRVAFDGPVQEAWMALLAYRDGLWNRRKRPVPLRAADRPLVVGVRGDALPRRALTQSWARLVTLAMAEGVVTRRFGLHGLKHRGVTDTEGTRAQKRQASGHKTEAMVARYDHEVPTVPAAGLEKIPRKPAENP